MVGSPPSELFGADQRHQHVDADADRADAVQDRDDHRQILPSNAAYPAKAANSPMPVAMKMTSMSSLFEWEQGFRPNAVKVRRGLGRPRINVA